MIKIWNIISLIIYMILFLMISIIPMYAGSISSFKDALRSSFRSALAESYKKLFSSSTLYKDYFTTYLKEMSTKETKCYSNRKILNENSIDCESLTQERIRLTTAFAQYDEKEGTVKTDNKTYQEIGVPLLIKKIPVQLTMGKAALTAKICSPTTVQADIKNAQSKQQFFEQNESITNELSHELKQSKSGEIVLLNMYNPSICSETEKTLILYDSKLLPGALKDSASARNAQIGIEVLTPLAKPLSTEYILVPAAKKLLANKNESTTLDPLKLFEPSMESAKYKFILEFGIPGGKIFYLDGIEPFFRLIKGIKERNLTDIGLSASHFALEVAYRNYLNNDEMKNKIKPVLNAMPYIEASVDCIRNAHALYQHRSSEDETKVHQSLIDVADYVRSAEKIYTMMQKNPHLKEKFSHFYTAYETVLHNENTKDLMDDLLKTDTFKDSPSPFSNPGRIAITSERLIKQKEQIMPLMKAMGELDAYIALTEFKKTQGKTTPFIYTQPTETKKAFIKAKGFVRPAISESIANDFELGDENKTAILTGPNGCGKSFATRALALNIILSQTAGCAQAEEFEHSSFDEVHCGANISDDETKSRYQAEVKLMGEFYAKNIENAREGKSAINILDEPLSATNERGGAKGTEEYIKRCGKIPNSNNLDIIITHHNLEDIDTVTHYQVEDNGTFKIELGRSTYSNAERMLRDKLDQIEKDFYFEQLIEEFNKKEKSLE